MEFPFTSTIAIAHRGAHDPEHPENSLVAVERAVKLGASAVEFDVCNLRDGELVVSHDNRIKANDVWVDLPTAASIDLERRLVYPSLPRIEPFLEVVANSNLLLNFDWKGLGAEYRIGDLLASYHLIERTIVSSTNAGALVRLKQVYPQVTTGLSLPASSDSFTEPASSESARHLRYPRARLPVGVRALIRGGYVDVLMVDHRAVSREVVAAVRGEDLGLFLWTARDVATFESLLRFAPDGIATDDIDQQLRYPSGRWKPRSFVR